MSRTQQDVEQLLRNIPLSTPQDESHAMELLQTFNSLRNSAFEGAGVSVPGMGIPFSIPALIDQMKAGNYTDVAVTLVSMGGDAAGAFSFLVTAGVEAGAISGTGALASAGVVSGMVAEAAGPAGIAVAVLVATFRIPSDTSANNAKLFFIADASGILTSWMFNMPEINPHAQLTRQARTGGYMRTDVSQHCRSAHDRVQELWRRHYQGNVQARRTAKQAAGDDWQTYWQQVGAGLSRTLQPSPNGIGESMVRRVIRETNQRTRRAASAAAAQRTRQQQRLAAGGYWFRSPDGVELFMPDR